MVYFITTYFPFILSAFTIYSMILAGKRDNRAWIVSILNQVLWLVWIVATHAWGLLPMNLALWVVYFRNYLKWRSE